MQIAILCGRLTKDVEIKTTKAGDKETTVGSFTLAVDDGYGDNKHTNFFPCSVFGKQAETMEKWVKKGTKVILNCKPRQNSYKDNNGNNHSYINFIVQSFEFANGKNESTEASGTQPTQEQEFFLFSSCLPPSKSGSFSSIFLRRVQAAFGLPPF